MMRCIIDACYQRGVLERVWRNAANPAPTDGVIDFVRRDANFA